MTFFTRLTDSMATYYAATHLPERCRIERYVGTTLTVQATGVPYRRAYSRPTDWQAEPALFVEREQPRARFGRTVDIRAQDWVEDLTDGKRYQVRGVQPDGPYGVTQTALMERRT